MSEEIDINKMAAEFVTHNLEKFYNTGKGVMKEAADKVRLRLSRSYRDYLECVAERYSKAKSFFIRNEPTSLYDFYVPIGISNDKTKISKASIDTITGLTNFAVVTGGGGSGKSMLMRHLLLDAIKQKERVPVFVELRELNQTEQSLLELIKRTLHDNRFTLDDDYIEKALKEGHFALLFDGFDEVVLSIRNNVRKQLLQLAKKYDGNVILVSSRPDNEFSGWPAFSVFRINPLTLEQAVELVEKLPFDDDLKTKFLKDLRGGLFQKHKSFLSNPLLLSIMLLTYGESADIPNKLSIFYSQAYEALFQRHDALKAGFQRERMTKLDKLDFARVFSAFSIQTYDKRMFQMSETEALEYLERAKKISGIQFESKDYLKDAEQAVCLLVEEGLMITFSHRSFQEYFAARFIVDAKPEIQKQLIDKYSKNLIADNVMSLLYEMKPEMVESLYIIPNLEKLEHLIGFKKKLGMTHYTRFIKAALSTIEFINGELFSLRRGKGDDNLDLLIDYTLDNCGYLVSWPGFDAEMFSLKSWRKYVNGEVGKINLYRIDTFNMTSKDELIHEIGAGHGLYSKQALESVLKVKQALIKKHESAERSIDEILRG